MNKKDTEFFKGKLEEELVILEKELEATGRKNPDHPGDWEPKPTEMDVLPSDENEVADKLESYQENQFVMNELEKRYNQVKNALERIKNDNYGVCKISGEPIERERLEANPAANTCIKHKDE